MRKRFTAIVLLLGLLLSLAACATANTQAQFLDRSMAYHASFGEYHVSDEEVARAVQSKVSLYLSEQQ